MLRTRNPYKWTEIAALEAIHRFIESRKPLQSGNFGEFERLRAIYFKYDAPHRVDADAALPKALTDELAAIAAAGEREFVLRRAKVVFDKLAQEIAKRLTFDSPVSRLDRVARALGVSRRAEPARRVEAQTSAQADIDKRTSEWWSGFIGKKQQKEAFTGAAFYQSGADTDPKGVGMREFTFQFEAEIFLGSKKQPREQLFKIINDMFNVNDPRLTGPLQEELAAARNNPALSATQGAMLLKKLVWHVMYQRAVEMGVEPPWQPFEPPWHPGPLSHSKAAGPRESKRRSAAAAAVPVAAKGPAAAAVPPVADAGAGDRKGRGLFSDAAPLSPISSSVELSPIPGPEASLDASDRGQPLVLPAPDGHGNAFSLRKLFDASSDKRLERTGSGKQLERRSDSVFMRDAISRAKPLVDPDKAGSAHVQKCVSKNIEALQKRGRREMVLKGGKRTGVDEGLWKDFGRANFYAGASRRELLVRENWDNLTTKQQTDARLAAVKDLKALAGGKAKLLMNVSKFMNQNVLAGIEHAMLTEESPLRLPDGSPGRLVGQSHVSFHVDSDGDSGLLLRCDYAIRDCTHFMKVPGGELVALRPGTSQAHFTFEVSIRPDGSASLSDPVKLRYDVQPET
jgi:hypothetical protein